MIKIEEIQPGRVLSFKKQVAPISNPSNLLELWGQSIEIRSTPEIKLVPEANNEPYLCVKVKAFSHEEEHWVTWLEIEAHGKLAEILTPTRAEKIALGMWKDMKAIIKNLALLFKAITLNTRTCGMLRLIRLPY